MMAVVSNKILFKALLSCLSGTANESETDASIANNRPMMHHHLSSGVSGGAPGGGRKRAGSFADESVGSKSLKLSHSPNVSKRTFAITSKPQFNIKTLAATIIFAAFENLDHWPASLIKAYADDCFGPRAWVDEPACQLLVQNLALAHTATAKDSERDSGSQDDKIDERAADALLVAEYYRIEESIDGGGSSRQNVGQRRIGR